LRLAAFEGRGQRAGELRSFAPRGVRQVVALEACARLGREEPPRVRVHQLVLRLHQPLEQTRVRKILALQRLALGAFHVAEEVASQGLFTISHQRLSA
jgi:hypothetical protein